MSVLYNMFLAIALAGATVLGILIGLAFLALVVVLIAYFVDVIRNPID